MVPETCCNLITIFISQGYRSLKRFCDVLIFPEYQAMITGLPGLTSYHKSGSVL